ncbi:MAG: hypothetical protein IJL39_03275 [Clostridia bacterium]|nr:hypothetical protein [Clostridia bacterium]
MFGISFYEFLFFATPLILIALLIISFDRYRSAKKQNEMVPGTISDVEIKKRKLLLIVIALTAGVFAAIVIGFIVFLAMALSSM